jgi:predicted negative regulator of RcsB-dependent stress response
VRAETRHQLKQDRFSRVTIEAAEKTAHWSAEHRSKLILGGAMVLVVAGIALGSWYYLNRRDQKASVDLAQAVRTLDTPVRPAGTPAQPDAPSFASSEERTTLAQKQFRAIVDNYPHTRSAEFARYFWGVTAAEKGDNASAERQLQPIADSGNSDLAALGKIALASVYRNTNRSKEAVVLYKELIGKPSQSVGKVMAQMELAATYEGDGESAEARKIYEQIQKENPSSEISQLASSKLQALK